MFQIQGKHKYMALSFSGCVWSCLGKNIFIWFCYCDKSKVWYYHPGSGTTKTVKTKVSVNMQDTFLVVTEFFSQQSRCLSIKDVITLPFSGERQFFRPHYNILDVPLPFLRSPFFVHCYSFTLNTRSISKWADSKVWGSIQPGLE